MATKETCKPCGKALATDGVFCTHCGTQSSDLEKTVLAVRRIREGTSTGQAQCPSCNALLGRGHVHCRLCGAHSQRLEGSGIAVVEGPDLAMERLAKATKDEFEIIRRLGAGGMGSVYLARELALQRHVAIKVLSPEFLSDEVLLERFRTEARIVARLRHRSIVVIHAVRHTTELHYFVMDYVEGASLGDVLRSHGPLPIPVVKAILYEVGSALAYAHREGTGIIHRDIKPGNIMLDSAGAVVVMDYGISKGVGTKAGLTMAGSIIGTLEYMSPEQCRGTTLTTASDQYALGLLGFAMLSGAPPFSGPHYIVIAAQVQEEPPRITDIRPDCPEDLANTLHRMLEKAPGDRWPTIPEALRAFGGRPHDLGDPVREDTGRLVSETEGATRVKVPVARVEVEEPANAVEPGDEISLSAGVYDDLGRVLAGRDIVWSTSDPGIITISPDDGQVWVLAPGSVSITAAAGGVSTTLELTVREPAPASIEVQPDKVQLRTESHALLRAVVKDRRDNPLASDARWSSSDGGVVAVSQTGGLHARAPGVAVITAEVEGLQARADITVEQPTVERIELLGLPELILVGDAFLLKAIQVGGSDAARVDVLWASTDDGIATVDGGAVRAHGVGNVAVTASTSGVEATAHLAIAERVVSELSLHAPQRRLDLGEQMKVTVEARDQRGDPLVRWLQWSSSDSAVLTVDQHGIVTGVAAGTAEVRALSESVSGILPIEVLPAPADAAAVTVAHISALPFEVRVGDDFELQATLVGGDDEQLRRPVARHSDKTKAASVVTVGGAATVSKPKAKRRWLMPATGVALPVVAVLAWLQFLSTDESQPTTAVPIVVESTVAVASVEISPPPAGPIRAGDSVPLTAMALDGEGQPVPDAVLNWRVDNAAVATVDQNGLLVASIAGTVRVSATADGVEGYVDVVITQITQPPPVESPAGDPAGQDPQQAAQQDTEPSPPPPAAIASVTVTIDDQNMEEGASQSYQVQVRDAGNAQLFDRSVSVRSTSDAVVVDVVAGRITASGPGDAYLVASAGTAVDSVRITVDAAVASVEIQGGNTTVTVDSAVDLRADVRGSLQQPLPQRSISWSSTDDDVLTVSQTGRALGRAPGSAQVVARSGGVEDRVTVVVAAPAIEPSAPAEETAQPVSIPVVVPAPSAAEARAEAERYVALLNSDAKDEVEALFGDGDDTGRSLLNRMDANGFTAELAGSVGPVTVDGDEATVRFGLRIRYRSNFGGNQERTGEIVAVLTNTSEGWRLLRCSVAPGSDF